MSAYMVESHVCVGCQATYWPKMFTGVLNDAGRVVEAQPAWMRQWVDIDNGMAEPVRRMWWEFAHGDAAGQQEAFDGATGLWRWFNFLVDLKTCGKERCAMVARMSHEDHNGVIGC